MLEIEIGFLGRGVTTAAQACLIVVAADHSYSGSRAFGLRSGERLMLEGDLQMSRILIALLLGLLCVHGLPAARVEVPLNDAAASHVLGELPEDGLIIRLQVAWAQAGSLVDTVGVAKAQPGSLQVEVLSDGALRASVYLPNDSQAGSDGWVRMRTRKQLVAGQPSRVHVAIGPSLILFINAAEQARIPGPAVWPRQTLYLGDYPGDGTFADRTEVARGMTGRVLVEGVGPGDTDFRLVTLERRASALVSVARDEAMRITREMLTLEPAQASGLHARARAQVRLGDLAAARVGLDLALSREPELAQAWYLRGWVRHEQGDLVGGIADLERGLQLREDAQAREWLAEWRQGGKPPPTAPGSALTGESRDLLPSRTPQTVDFAGGVRVTLPPELLRSASRLVIDRSVTPPEAPAAGLKRLAGFDLTLGEQHALPAEMHITLPYDPNRLPADVPLEVSLIAGRFERDTQTWVELPIDVDPVGNTVTVRTRHLTWIEVYYVGSAYKILPGGTFGVFFDEASVRAAKDADYQARHPSAIAGVPDFVNDVHQFAAQALKAYSDKGLKPYSSPVWILVCGSGSSSYNRVLRRAFITFDANSSAELQYTVSHELFHAVQLANYNSADYAFGDHRWWLEASAEFAASRLPFHYAWMGKRTEGPMPPKLLTKAPDYFGQTDEHDLERYSQYRQAYLLEWLANAARAADEPDVQSAWVPMYKYVVAHKSQAALAAIDDFLKQRLGPDRGFDFHYRAFALHYLLSPASPMGRAKVAGDVVHPVAVENTLKADLRNGQLIEFRLSSYARHTARMWLLALEPAAADIELSLAAPLAAGDALYFARLPDGNRTGHSIVARFESPRAGAVIATLGPKDKLVAILVSAAAGSQATRFRVRQIDADWYSGWLAAAPPRNGRNYVYGVDDLVAIYADKSQIHLATLNYKVRSPDGWESDAKVFGETLSFDRHSGRIKPVNGLSGTLSRKGRQVELTYTWQKGLDLITGPGTALPNMGGNDAGPVVNHGASAGQATVVYNILTGEPQF